MHKCDGFQNLSHYLPDEKQHTTNAVSQKKKKKQPLEEMLTVKFYCAC